MDNKHNNDHPFFILYISINATNNLFINVLFVMISVIHFSTFFLKKILSVTFFHLLFIFVKQKRNKKLDKLKKIIVRSDEYPENKNKGRSGNSRPTTNVKQKSTNTRTTQTQSEPSIFPPLDSGQRTAVNNSNPTAANLTVRNQFTTKKISEAENKTKQNRKKN